MDPIKVGLLLGYIVWIQWILLWVTNVCIRLDKVFVSFERIQKIIAVETEKFNEGNIPNQNWGNEGKLEFKNFFLKYRPETEMVLKDLTFEVKP